MEIVIVITKVYGNNEFREIFEIEGSSPYKVEKKQIYVFNGNDFLVKEAGKPDGNKIFQKIKIAISDHLNNDNKVYITYHAGQHTFNIDAQLKNLKNVQDVKQYGTGRNNREKIKTLIKSEEEFKLGEFIEEFFENETLKAKLNLLHQCLTPNGAKDADWPKELQNQENAKAKLMKLKKINGNDPFDSEYIEALTNLRESLLNQ